MHVRSRDLFWNLIVFTVYVGTAYLCLQFDSVNTFAAPVWVPTGIAIGALAIGGYRLWPSIILGALSINLLFGAPFLVAAGIATGNTLEALAGAYLISRFTVPNELFRKLKQVFAFLASVTAASLFSAVIGVTSLWLGGLITINEIPLTWVTWLFGDILGALVIAPLLITWASGYAYPVGTFREHVTEFVLLLGFVGLVNWVTFLRPPFIPDHIPLLYLAIGPLIWAAIQFGPRGTTLAIGLNLAIAVIATALGYGPFTATAYTEGALYLQIYTATMSIGFLVFAAIVKEHKYTSEKLGEYVTKMEFALNKIRSEDRAKTEFLAVLAHELRNPLAPVVSALELIKLKGLGSRDAMQAVAIMDKQLKNATGLLDDLLDISRISERKIKLNTERVDMRMVIAHSVVASAPVMKSNQHSVTVSGGEERLLVLGEALRLEQVMVNILNNAAKYTNPGGMIVINATQTAQAVTIRVRDNGIGIAPHMLTQIFEPFLQVARDGGKQSAGLGIGLSLTKKLVELHGGAITAMSEGLGRGSEFIIELPRVQEKKGVTTPEPVPKSKVASTGTARHKILVVDDNEPAAEGLGKLLAHRGHEVRLAFDGDSALATAEVFSPTVAILDIGLPDRDGYEIARELRKSSIVQPILIAVTGYGQDDDKARARLAGFDYHLTKPVGIREFDAILSTAKKKRVLRKV
ncbi:MAG: MASE1 domain-containing protein [Patescibacteria group bacterium]